MNRMDEYQELLKELDAPVPGLEGTLDRAMKRRKKRRYITIPALSSAAAVLIFIFLVNFSTTVAYACSNIPILRELAEAVTFNPSLRDAVEHDYVQTLNLSKTKDDMTAYIDYVIVDQKQLNIFLHFETKKYETIQISEVDAFETDGVTELICSKVYGGTGIPAEELQQITIDFVEEEVPEQIILEFTIKETDTRFEFLLELDPDFTSKAVTYDLNKTLTLDGQNITFTTLEIYPTHLRVNITDDPDNTSWLKSLDFHIKTNTGNRFETVSNGISATGGQDTKSMVSFRTDSPYFYEADSISIVIDSIKWLSKDKETCRVNLKTGDTHNMPEGINLDSADPIDNGWEIKLSKTEPASDNHYQLFEAAYYSPDGEYHTMTSWGSGNETVYGQDYLYQILTIEDYPYDEILLCPNYSHEWTPKEPVELIVK